MARTALEMTPEELRAYNPIREPYGEEVEPRWRAAWDLARAAAALLRERYGATRVVLFGTLTRRDWFTPWSDVDLAVSGIPGNRYLSALEDVNRLDPEIKVDLVEAEDCRKRIATAIEREGVEL